MTTMNYTNEFYVKPARHLAAVANALRVLEVPGVEVNEAEARRSSPRFPPGSTP